MRRFRESERGQMCKRNKLMAVQFTTGVTLPRHDPAKMCHPQFIKIKDNGRKQTRSTRHNHILQRSSTSHLVLIFQSTHDLPLRGKKQCLKNSSIVWQRSIILYNESLYDTGTDLICYMSSSCNYKILTFTYVLHETPGGGGIGIKSQPT